MATKQSAEKLTPIPKPKRSRSAAEPPQPVAGVASVPTAEPDTLDRIAANLRPLAVPIGELNFDPANARRHSEGSVSAIAASLKVYGQVKPVVVLSDNGVVIAGNGTLQAALDLNWTHLAAVKVDMDAATAAGYAISDNRTAELSEWDRGALDALLREVRTDNDSRLDAMMAELAEELQLGQAGKLAPGWQGIEHDKAEPPQQVVAHLVVYLGEIGDFEQRISAVAHEGERPIRTLMRGLHALSTQG